MRPILFDVDLAASPPTFSVLFAGEPHRIATLKFKTDVAGLELAAAQTVAIAELNAMSAGDLELVREIATPLDRASLPPDPAPVE